MGWPKLLVLVRHAESEGNLLPVDSRARLKVATHAYSLTSRGRKQARITGQYLRERFGEFDAYYTSDYRRAAETMRIMYPRVRACEDPRLAEAQRGIYHTMTRAQIKKKFPEELARKELEGLYRYRPIGGESWPDVEERIRSFQGTLEKKHENERVLVVTHGHWLILFQRLVHSFGIEEAKERYHMGVVENASVAVYTGAPTEDVSWQDLFEESIVPWEGKLPKISQTTK